jgi:SPP1 family predicted phage head-tail adaptor
MGLQFIDPGRLRTELRLEGAVAVEDGAGGHAQHWEERGLLFGHVEPMSVRTQFGAGQDHEAVTHRVTIRFREGVQAGMRFVTQGRQLTIITVRDLDERGRYLLCQAREEA